jgi:hypothetical protein
VLKEIHERGLWEPFRLSDAGTQGNESRVLLANNEQGLSQADSTVRQVSKVCSSDEEPP